MSQKFETIARFQYSTEAQIVKGRLEAEGIKVFLRDNLTIDTDPLVSNAIGGVKLQVLSENKVQALEVLESIGKYALTNDGKLVRCPNCESHNINVYSTIKDFKSFISFIIGFVLGTLPFSTRYVYKCEDCNTEFPIK